MDAIWLLGLVLFAAVMFYIHSQKPKASTAALYFLAILAICGILWQSGVQTPGKGADLSNPTMITFTTNTYTTSNNAIVLITAWLTFFYGTWGWYMVLIRTFTGRVNADGTFK